MNKAQEKQLLKRLSAVESNVGRLVQAVSGMAQAINMAAALPGVCGQCGDNPANKPTCGEKYCPQGKDAKASTAPTKDPNIPSKDNSVVYPDEKH